MAKSSKQADLLNAIRGNSPVPVTREPVKTQAPAAPVPTTLVRETVSPGARSKPTKPTRSPASSPPKAIRGKAIQFYLHDADEKLIREISVWFAAQRKRINDSLVIKAVLRAAKTGPGLLAAYDDAASIDGRLKSHKKPKPRM